MENIIRIKNEDNYSRKKNKICIFCNKASNLSQEHVIPHWLISYLSISNEIIAPARKDFLTNQVIIQRNSYSINQFVTKLVCVDCNNGWMSELENTNIQTLKLLMENKITLNELPYQKKKLIAKWAIKTAYMINCASNFYKHIPLEHFHKFYNACLASNILVTGTQVLPSRKFWWYESNILLAGTQETKEQSKIYASASYCTSIQIGNLILGVFYWPNKDWIYQVWKKSHILLEKNDAKIEWFNNFAIPILPDFNTEFSVRNFSFSVCPSPTANLL